VAQIHLGGGTPTYLQPTQLERLQKMIHDRFDVDAQAEISIEVDPVVTSEDHIRTLRGLGYNRISMGVQDLNPQVQEAVHRVQPEPLTERFYRLCREVGFLSVNMDLIYGLPHQTPQTFAKTVDKLIAWGPDRVAVFNYAHVPWIKPHQKLMPEEALPAPDSKFAMFVDTRRRFEAAGYEAIGLDHFALPGDELAQARRDEVLRRNFMGYTTKPETDILALGVSSISDVGGAYAQNFTRLVHYYRAVEAGELPTHRGVHMSEDDRIRRDVIMDIMCNFVLQKPRIESRYGIDFDVYFAAQEESLASLEDDGLIHREPDRIEVTPLGQLLVRNVAMVFDAYLRPPSESGTPLYSRTV
jgi:oxygen-independent coproporphyrinogen-3 oxidase